jgi:hypothetical protein
MVLVRTDDVYLGVKGSVVFRFHPSCRLHLLRRYSRMQVGEGEFFGEVIGLKNSGGLVRPKAKVLISQCSTKTPSFMRIMSVAITAGPMPENRPWMMAFIYFSVRYP